MSNSDMSKQQAYKLDDVQEIIQLALIRQANQVDNEELSRFQLEEIARDLGIKLDDLQLAEQDWVNNKLAIARKQEFIAYRQGKLKQKAIKYAIVNSFLVVINLISASTLSWSIYVILIWGIFLSLDTWKTFQTSGEEYDRAFQSWRAKAEIKRSVVTIWDKIKRFIEG